ncbi:hypothetical protein H671_8g19191 [Cricetulus griseus]|nr:hypothetical protein H671_8g19191 [Cricetulus griseus]
MEPLLTLPLHINEELPKTEAQHHSSGAQLDGVRIAECKTVTMPHALTPDGRPVGVYGCAKCPSSNDERIMKIWNIYTMGYYSAAKKWNYEIHRTFVYIL